MHSPPTGDTSGVLVLGMHRSGTSAVARVINMLGPTVCADSDLIRGIEWNPLGHWESRSLNHFNDSLLAATGSTWWSPPPPPGTTYDDLTRPVFEVAGTVDKARIAFRAAHPSSGAWVWKDPRTCLTLPFWRRVLGFSVVGLAVLRDPIEVAGSLELRNGFPVPFGLALWERYTRHWLAHSGGMPLLVARYSDLLNDPVGWATGVRTFLSRAGIAVGRFPDPATLTDYVDQDHRHVRRLPSPHDDSRERDRVQDMAAMLDGLVGEHVSFVPPEISEEPALVSKRLQQWGPQRRPQWRRPPWAGVPLSSDPVITPPG